MLTASSAWNPATAADYAAIVTQALRTQSAANQVYDILGLEAVPRAEALRRYLAVAHPGLPLTTVGFGTVRFLALLARPFTPELAHVVEFMRWNSRFV